ncbi:MAG: SDR family oxidoreductase [FCB group bacterium]|nr:SDR family oxidoreductase [FCB group bacterium]
MGVRELGAGVVVISGASTGIGKSCAEYLARMGFRVYAGVRREADGEAVKEASPERIVPLMLDVTDAGSIAAAAARVATEAPEGVAGLVNNAGIVVPGPLELLPIDEIRRQLEVNLLGTIATTQAFLPQVRKATGRIVNMGSINGLLATPLGGPYCMSKFALEAYSDVLRMELKRWGIEVSLLEPGSIKTPIWEKSRAFGMGLYERLPEEGRAMYDPMVQGLRRTAEKVAGKGVPPERVAEVVAHALTAVRPRTRYRVGNDSKMYRLLARWVPDRLRDRIVLKGMGMG